MSRHGPRSKRLLLGPTHRHSPPPSRGGSGAGVGCLSAVLAAIVVAFVVLYVIARSTP